MTNEIAIKLLKEIRKFAILRDGDIVAIDMAIKALEHGDVLQEIRSIAMESLHNYKYVDGLGAILDVIKELSE